MSETIYVSGEHDRPCLCIERQPGCVTDPMVVSFRKWNGRRSLLNQSARWTGAGWDPKRWVPKPPTISAEVLVYVENRMKELEA